MQLTRYWLPRRDRGVRGGADRARARRLLDSTSAHSLESATGVALLIVALIVWMINWMYPAQRQLQHRARRGGAGAGALRSHRPLARGRGAPPAERNALTDPFQLMGIVNVTPDSFSDGGASWSRQRGRARRCELDSEGAEILDIGGESTRPGAAPVPETEELARVAARDRRPARRRLRGRRSRSTPRRPRSRPRRSPRARRSSTTSPRCAATRRWRTVVAGSGARLLPDAHARRAAHDAARPAATTRSSPTSGASSRQRMAFAIAHGIAEDRILLDPGDRLRQDARAQPGAAAAAATRSSRSVARS